MPLKHVYRWAAGRCLGWMAGRLAMAWLAMAWAGWLPPRHGWPLPVQCSTYNMYSVVRNKQDCLVYVLHACIYAYIYKIEIGK